MKRRLDSKRSQGLIREELIRFGGERAVEDMALDDAEREEFDWQCLVLSDYREHGDLSRAALEYGVSPSTAHEWNRHNIHQFKARISDANREIAARVQSSIVERILSGEMKNPTVILHTLKHYDPERFDDKTPDDGRKGIMADMGKQRRKFLEEVDAAAEKRANEMVKALLVDMDEENAKVLAGKLLKLKEEHGSS